MYRFLITLILIILPGISHSAAKEELIIISSHWEGIKREFENAFKKYQISQGKNEPEIRWLDIGGTVEIMKFINETYKRDSQTSNIDLIFGGGTDSYIELGKRGLLEPFKPADSIISQIPKELLNNPLYDENFNWFATALSGFGIIYNKKALSILGLKEPVSWEDLGNSQAFSLVGFGDPRRSGSAHMIVEIILQSYGWEKGWQILFSIGKNIRSFTSSSAQVTKDISVGDVAYGVLIDSYANEAIRLFGDNNIGYTIPSGLSLFSGEGLALLKGAPNKILAGDFINFVLSETGQKLFAAPKGVAGGPVDFYLGKLPVLPKVYEELKSQIRTNPYNFTTNFVYNSNLAAQRWYVLNDLLGVFLVENQRTLQSISDLSKVKMPIAESETNSLSSLSNWMESTDRKIYLEQWLKLSSLGLTINNKGILVFKFFPLLLIITLFFYRKSRSFK